VKLRFHFKCRAILLDDATQSAVYLQEGQLIGVPRSSYCRTVKSVQEHDVVVTGSTRLVARGEDSTWTLGTNQLIHCR
jgi:hypothetical protein